MKLGALAACIALFLGIGTRFLPAAAPTVTTPVPTAAPTLSDPVLDDRAEGDRAAFTAAGPADDAKLAFPSIHTVDYADATDAPELSASLLLPDGAFAVPLSRSDIQKLFWGPDGKPPVENPKMDPGDFPLTLMQWAGYTVTGQATYDGSGDLWELSICGEKGADSFTLRAAPGRIPPACAAEPGAAVTDVGSVQVSGWYRSYDRDGDGVIEHVCVSQFLANGVGFRFENVGSGGMQAGEHAADDLGGAKLFNAMVVTQLCGADGFYLDQLAHNDHIPSWTEESYDALAQALAGAEAFAMTHPEADFLTYLPAEGPAGFGEFHGRLSYQEEAAGCLWVRWSKGYDNVEVAVYLPEDNYTNSCTPVEIRVPESYDYRLYTLPLGESVPREYLLDFSSVTFRAEDMSLEAVKARETAHDTGGSSFRFKVLHENGVVVRYSCDGMTAEQVWALVEPTLSGA